MPVPPSPQPTTTQPITTQPTTTQPTGSAATIGAEPTAGTACSSPEDGPTPRRRPGLSPSRAKDFMQCPLLFRFRVVDRLPEPPSAAAVRGTLVHSVLEKLFDEPAGRRTLPAAVALVGPAWQELVTERPECVEVLDDPDDLTDWYAQAEALLTTYFTLEDPNRLQPAERELQVSVEVDGLELRGIVDRVDVAPDGAIRIVDYKTGRSPNQGYEGDALFQMRFYALIVSRLRGRMPKMLQLVYLGDGSVLRHVPDDAEIATIEKRIRAIWSGIEDAAVSGDWRPRPSRLCDWCAHRSICPAFDGTPPEVDPDAVERAIGVRPT